VDQSSHPAQARAVIDSVILRDRFGVEVFDGNRTRMTSLEDRCWSTGHDVPLHTCRPRRADDPWLTVSDRPSLRHLARMWPDSAARCQAAGIATLASSSRRQSDMRITSVGTVSTGWSLFTRVRQRPPKTVWVVTQFVTQLGRRAGRVGT
jgi:hypothetical protein